MGKRGPTSDNSASGAVVNKIIRRVYMGANPKKNTPPPKQNKFRGNAASTVIMFNKWREAAKNFAVPAPPPPPAPPPTPLHHWKLDEGRGPDAYDTGTSATKVKLTLQGNAKWLGGGGVELPNGGATKNSFLDFGPNFQFAARDGFTFAVWAKVDSFENDWGKILSLCNFQCGNVIILNHYSTTRRARVIITNSNSYKVLNTPDCNSSDRANDSCYFFPVAGSRWVHVALTVTAGGAWSLYRDGATQDATQWNAAATGGVTANPNSVNYTFAALGRDDAGTEGSDNYLDGALRDARLYDRALSAAEIKHIFDYTKRG